MFNCRERSLTEWRNSEFSFTANKGKFIPSVNLTDTLCHAGESFYYNVMAKIEKWL